MSTTTPLLEAFWLAAGIAGGSVHFALLRWNTRLYLAGANVARALGVQAARLAAVAALLVVAALHGAMPLLAAAIGVVLARLLVLRVLAITP